MIDVYGADWCPDCRMLKKQLDKNSIDYNYIDIEEGDNQDAMLKITKGKKIIPTVVKKDKYLQEPSWQEVEELINE